MWQISIKDVQQHLYLFARRCAFLSFIFVNVQRPFGFFFSHRRCPIKVGGIKSIDTFCLYLTCLSYQLKEGSTSVFLISWQRSFFSITKSISSQVERKSWILSCAINLIEVDLHSTNYVWAVRWMRRKKKSKFEKVWHFSVRWINKRHRKRDFSNERNS